MQCEGRLELGEGVSKLGGIMPVWDQFKDCKHIVIVACGTSYHSGCVGEIRIRETDGSGCGGGDRV